MACKQSNNEYYWTYCDKFLSLVRKSFARPEQLYFVTYQPVKGSCLSADEVARETFCLFGEITYIFVPEQTFRQNRRDRSGSLTDNWHAHLIVDQEGLSLVMSLEAKKFDIITKWVWSIDGLVAYLAKQANKNRILPILSTPTKYVLPNETMVNLTYVSNVIRPSIGSSHSQHAIHFRPLPVMGRCVMNVDACHQYEVFKTPNRPP